MQKRIIEWVFVQCRHKQAFKNYWNNRDSVHNSTTAEEQGASQEAFDFQQDKIDKLKAEVNTLMEIQDASV